MIRWRPRQERVVLACYTVALYMTVVDSTIIFTALPSLARDFHASLDAAQWVTLSYLLSLAVAVPSSGWIGDRFGTRRTFLTALVLFTGVLRAVRPVRLADPAGHLPGDPGHRRRPDHPGRPGHDVPHLPARAPRPGPGHGRAGHGPRPGHRARAGRDTHHRAVLAVVLLRQYPVRDRRSGHRAAVPVRAPRACRGPAGHRRLRAGRRRPGAVPVRPQRGAGAGLDQPGHHRHRHHQPGRAGQPGGARAAAEDADAEPAAAAQPDLPHHQPGLAVPGRAATTATCSSCPSSCRRPAGPRR